MARPRGVFIVLEGPDRSGKSTQAARLARALRAAGRRVVHTREPGGTAFAEAIRSILLDPAHRVQPLAELLLYEAARAQHTEEVVRPALTRGEVVLSERYTLATLVYQGLARGLPLDLVRRMNRVATGGLEPDLTVVLDIPDREFGRRAAGRGKDRLEAEGAGFRAKVRSGYLRLARTEPRTALVRGVSGEEAVAREVMAAVARRLRRLGVRP